MEDYFIVYDNRATEQRKSIVNNIGISACEGHTAHIDMLDDDEGLHIPESMIPWWTSIIEYITPFYEQYIRGQVFELALVYLAFSAIVVVCIIVGWFLLHEKLEELMVKSHGRVPGEKEQEDDKGESP
jgi:hypothetical protein